MGLFTRKTPERSLPVLVASAEVVKTGDATDAQKQASTRQIWQQRAYQYYDDIGEIHFAGRYIGNALAKIRLIGAERPEFDSDEPPETTNQAVKDAVNKLRSRRGGQGGLLRTLGINIFIAGECFLLGREENELQIWEAVSVNELEMRPGEGPMRRGGPNMPFEPLPEGTLVVRVWNPHPRYSDLADSALRTVLGECEKLLLLSRADKAAARSRFAGAGLLFIPSELIPVSQQNANTDASPDAQENPIYDQLIQSMINPIKDEQHPSGVVPITIFGPGEYGDKIKYLNFDRPQAQRAQAQREDSITRIATAIDLPPEILTGKADLNHWTAFQVQEETFAQHLQPFVELICDALTVAYLHPALERAGVTDFDKYLVWYDDSALIVRPDKGQTANQLHDGLAISDAAWRRETGFGEEDKPDDQERALRVGVLLQDAQMALTGKPTPPPPAAGGGGPAPTQGGDSPTIKEKLTADKPAKTKGELPDESTRPGAAKAVTASGKKRRRYRENVGVYLAQLDVELMTQLRAAASEVLVRELERAGARIRSKVGNSAEHKDLLAEVPNHLVASVLGPSLVASLDLSDQELMRGAFETFGQRANVLIANAQAQRNRLLQQYLTANEPRVRLGPDGGRWNEPPERERDRDVVAGWNAPPVADLYASRDDDDRDTAVGLLIAGLTAFAFRKLYDPAPDSLELARGEFDGTLVPASLIRETISPVGTGQTTDEILNTYGVPVVARQWVYGPAIRTPFESHENLDGVEFTSWDDESLAVNDGDEWLELTPEQPGYHPGDHRGCLCAVAPIVDEDETEA